MTLSVFGDFALAKKHYEQGISLYNPRQHDSQVLIFGQDPGVSCLSFNAWSLWSLGYPDQAVKRIQEAYRLAQELSHPYSLAYASSQSAFLHQLRREGQATQEQAELVISLSLDQGFPFWSAYVTILRGWARSDQGQEEEGITEMRQGLTAWRTVGAEAVRSHHLALLAESYGKVGQVDDGLAAVAEALNHMNKTGERFYEAEVYRIKGTLTLQLKVESGEWKVEEAEACFLKAIAIAQKQQAKSLELRATMSLARLWQQQGKQQEARQMLAEIYGWFTEGFDTKDLQEAKTLIEELSD